MPRKGDWAGWRWGVNFLKRTKANGVGDGGVGRGSGVEERGGAHIELALMRGIIQRIPYVVAIARHAGRRGSGVTIQVAKEEQQV